MSQSNDTKVSTDVHPTVKLCISGYIRKLQRELPMEIPSTIQALCILFYYDKISLSMADGCANSYKLQYPEKPNFFYRGIRPSESCSGEYSGGPDVEYNVESEQEAMKWRDLVNDVLNDTDNQSQRRPKGMWIIRNATDSKSCYIRKGETFNKLKGVLIDIKSKGDKTEQSEEEEDWW